MNNKFYCFVYLPNYILDRLIVFLINYDKHTHKLNVNYKKMAENKTSLVLIESDGPEFGKKMGVTLKIAIVRRQIKRDELAIFKLKK